MGICGHYITGDHPSGRLIKFPNEKVLDEIVYNYSWPLFPYIWNEVKFQVAYNADLEFIANTMQKITEEVSPREAGRVKSRLIKKLVAALNAAPDRVMFPAGANR
jgi:small-conductance mechanosensitive channel